MPYIKPINREKFKTFVDSMELLQIDNSGELNYLLTLLTHRYLNQAPESYQGYADAVSALENAKLELYRRHVASYEDEKIEENGDV